MEVSLGRNFGTHAADYEKGRAPYGETLLDFVTRKIHELFPHARLAEIPVIDLGCGTGKSTVALYEKGLQNICGLDSDEEMLAEARKKPGNYIKGEIAHLKTLIPTDTFNVITAFTAFHWFCTPTEISAIKTIMATDAIFIVVTKSDRTNYSDAQIRFFKMLRQIRGSALQNPYQGFKPCQSLEENGFELEVQYFTKETTYDSETLKSRARSASGWWTLSEEQKSLAEPELEKLVQSLILEQGSSDGRLSETTEEMCLIGRLKS